MNKEHIKREITNLLDAINEQVAVINSHQHNIPQIELDIVTENLRKLYQSFALLNKYNQMPQAEAKPAKEPSAPSHNVDKAEKEAPSSSLKEEKAKTSEEKSEEIKADASVSEEKSSDATNKKTEAETTKSESPDLFSEAKTMSDKFKNDTKSINEKIAQNIVDRTLASKIKKSPIADLKAAIGINEKFLFINELFGGDLAAYNEAVDKLNAFQSIEEAANLLENLHQKRKWQEDSPAFLMLSELVSRRYMT